MLPAGPTAKPTATPAEGGTLPPSDTPAPSPTPPLPLDVAITIDLAKQRACLLRGGVVELESPVSSGRAGHLTPTGDFAVVEKDPNHKSSLYGNFVKISSGRIVRRNAESIMPVPEGCRFEGALMKFFVRFEGAAGTHAGVLPGYPASHGCVRMPAAKAEAFYNAVRIGTPVRVFGQTPVRSSVDGDRKKAEPAAAPKTIAPEPAPTPRPKRIWWPFGKRQQGGPAV